MTYSIWNYGTRLFDYYRTGNHQGTHVTQPAPSVFGNELGLTPDEFAWKLPTDATKVGSGTEAKGRISSSSSGLRIPEWMVYAAVIYVAWKVIR